MSARSSHRRHPASLIPISAHNPYLVNLMASRISPEMIDYVARQATKVIRLDCDSPVNGTSRTSYKSYFDPATSPHSLRNFIGRIVKESHVQVSTFMSSLVYLERLRSKLPTLSEGLPCTIHRIFLATLIVTAKYLNDSCPKNIHWAKYSNLFTVTEINLMEIQLLYLLDYDLRFNEEEACALFAPYMSIVARQASTRASAVDKVAKASKARALSQEQNLRQSVTSSEDVPPAPFPVSRPISLVRGLARRLSMAHIRADSVAPLPMPTALTSKSTSTTSSSSTSSSDICSLVDDTGSSSSSSSGISSESESETEEHVEPRVYSSSYGDYYQALTQEEMIAPGKKPFLLRPSPAYVHRNHHITQNRSRKPSDASSVRTITALSPTQCSSFSSISSLQSRRSSGKRSVSGATTIATGVKESSITASVTMPAITRSAGSGGFLSRMWGAAKGQALGHEKSASLDYDTTYSGQGPNTLKKLVLVHSRAANTRNGGAFNV
ncbi:uncharacterized protein EV420DRAFT_1765425 [Desarmillaria tabescens]|uniref:Cyclin N-terminal domain-containing protein n=1 Tax=Armillaria tabescens TaxID=1929756 RepID=A0AA39K9J1_ARMTA|nr:uncharacterized protein EV420DRAFT_1765425 [Desarmillaria tabescens]KAK0455786.1 hypothetical protein EV420DRAFT_1765425 [Desarmillaria tabescens]